MQEKRKLINYASRWFFLLTTHIRELFYALRRTSNVFDTMHFRRGDFTQNLSERFGPRERVQNDVVPAIKYRLLTKINNIIIVLRYRVSVNIIRNGFGF